MIPFKYVFAYNVTLAIGILIGFIYIFPVKIKILLIYEIK